MRAVHGQRFNRVRGQAVTGLDRILVGFGFAGLIITGGGWMTSIASAILVAYGVTTTGVLLREYSEKKQ